MPCCLIILPNGSMYKVKRLSKNRTLWNSMTYSSVWGRFKLTNWNISHEYNLNQSNAVLLIPVTCSSLSNRMLWLIISNTTQRSNRRSLITFTYALNPDWKSWTLCGIELCLILIKDELGIICAVYIIHFVFYMLRCIWSFACRPAFFPWHDW